ncbi:MAG: hypothetical protein U0172_06805 [Nitrospiraceae bacterium]
MQRCREAQTRWVMESQQAAVRWPVAPVEPGRMVQEEEALGLLLSEALL